MGRGALKRLAGCLKEFFDPVSSDGERDQENRDGKAERKPCAVIGIPYSSDAGEPAESEDEKTAKTVTKYMLTIAAVGAAAMVLGVLGGAVPAGGKVGTPVSTAAAIACPTR